LVSDNIMTVPLPLPSKKLGKSMIIAIAVIVVLSVAIVGAFVLNESKKSPSSVVSTPTPTASPDISGVQVVNYSPNWELVTGTIRNKTVTLVNPYLDITIKNPTQYTVYIWLYGTADITITGQGNVKNDYSCYGSQAFTLTPYSENNYQLNMVYSLNYVANSSDNINVAFNHYNVSEKYVGTNLLVNIEKKPQFGLILTAMQLKWEAQKRLV